MNGKKIISIIIGIIIFTGIFAGLIYNIKTRFNQQLDEYKNQVVELSRRYQETIGLYNDIKNTNNILRKQLEDANKYISDTRTTVDNIERNNDESRRTIQEVIDNLSNIIDTIQSADTIK